MLLLQKIFLNFTIEMHWLRRGPGSLFSRVNFSIRKYLSILRDQHQILFLGRTLHYDNRLMPALLPDYYFEIEELGRTLSLAGVRHVFDIGANVGQFAFAFKYFNSSAEIYSFEPNPVAYRLLDENARGFEKWRSFPFGLGETSASLDFYYVEGKSAQGSVFRANAVQGLLSNDCRETKIEIKAMNAETAREFALPAEVDLIKIDVEGAERDVLKAVREIRWRFIYMEISESREGGMSLNEALAILGGAPGVVMRTEPQGISHTFQVLLKR